MFVIIDMQGCFPAANDATLISNVERRIDVAKQRDEHIVLVELRFPPIFTARTHARIRNRLACYARCIVVFKRDDDGGPAIRRRLGDFGVEPTYFDVGGVNTHCCVRDTVRGLRTAYPKVPITVLLDCCRCDCTDPVSPRDFPFGNVGLKKNTEGVG